MKPLLSMKEVTKLCNCTESVLLKRIGKASPLPERLKAKVEKAKHNAKSQFSLNQLKQILQSAGMTVLAEIIQEQITNRPKIEAYDHFLNAEGLKSMNAVAKELGTGLKRLFAFLREQKVFFLSGDTNLPHQHYVTPGYFEVKGPPYKDSDSYIAYSQIFVTPKGEDWIAALLRKHANSARKAS